MPTNKRIDDVRRKKIIADYVQNGSYSETARMNSVSVNGVKKIVQKCTPFVQAVQAKNEQNTADILEYMNGTKDRVCELVDVYLNAMLNVDKIDKAKLSELSTVFGTVIDKYMKLGIIRIQTAETGEKEQIKITFEGEK